LLEVSRVFCTQENKNGAALGCKNTNDMHYQTELCQNTHKKKQSFPLKLSKTTFRCVRHAAITTEYQDIIKLNQMKLKQCYHETNQLPGLTESYHSVMR